MNIENKENENKKNENDCIFENAQKKINKKIEEGKVKVFNPNENDLDHDCCGG